MLPDSLVGISILVGMESPVCGLLPNNFPWWNSFLFLGKTHAMFKPNASCVSVESACEISFHHHHHVRAVFCCFTQELRSNQVAAASSAAKLVTPKQPPPFAMPLRECSGCPRKKKHNVYIYIYISQTYSLHIILDIIHVDSHHIHWNSENIIS